MQRSTSAGKWIALSSIVAVLTTAFSASAAPRRAHGTTLRRVSATNADSPPSRPFGWLAGRLPAGGAITEDGAIVHTVQTGETWASIAEKYVDYTSIYHPDDLATAIAAENAPASKKGAPALPGVRVRIPHVLREAPKMARLPLPDDSVVKGIYVRGSTAGSRGYTALLDRVKDHGMNAIVLDVKDYDGPITYPSKVALAVSTGATADAPMRSYSRAVRFAHDRGIHVIARVSCFNDAWMSKAHPGMAIRGISGHPFRNGWVDPKSEIAQQYVRDLVVEAMDNGADEVQLDYVRFPVSGMKFIDFGLDTKKDPRAKVDVISHFVDSVHTLTKARHVPLSLDVFGVIAFGNHVDIENLGQDPAELATRSEFLSAMVYPSHYDPGFMGLEEPGNHPELVGLGVKNMLEEMEEHGVDLRHAAKIRPWLQAMRHRSSNYGPAYVQNEIRTGDDAGAAGWLLWNPSQTYDVAWRATQKAKAKN